MASKKTEKRLWTGTVVAAVLGSLIHLSGIAENWPYPMDFIGSIIVFVAVLLIAVKIITTRG